MWSRGSRLLGALASLALAACGGQGAEPPPPAAPQTTCPIAAPVAEPTFVGHILPALRLSCGAGGAFTCHGGTTPPGHVSYDPARPAADVHASLVGAAPANAPAGYELVAAGDRAHSWLLVKVTEDAPGGSGGYGKRMPMGEPPLCAATVTTLATWIDRGAPLGP